jgi:hypothetical protein
MSLTSYRAAPPRDTIVSRGISFITRFGGDLLSHVLRRSTIGVLALNFRVRDGIGCLTDAMTTKPRNEREHQSLLGRLFSAVNVRVLVLVLLFLDQIKPIEQLVPVS